MKSLRKALTLLDAFTGGSPEWGLRELSEKFEIPKPTVHHIMTTFVELGWLEQDSKTKRYRPGLRLWEKGQLAVGRVGARDLARPFLEELAADSKETVHLAILDPVDAGYVIYLDKVESVHPVRTYSMIGDKAPSYCVATGKAMLARNPDLASRVLARKLRAYTDYTITDPRRLLEELRLTQHRGFSIHQSEYHQDVTGIAAAVRDREGRAFAAVGISGPAYRFSTRFIAERAPTIVSAAHQLSLQMGFSDRAGPSPRFIHGSQAESGSGR